MASGKRRDVAADQHGWAGSAGEERASHAPAEVALSLAVGRNAGAPPTGFPLGVIGRDRKARPPARIASEPAQEQSDHAPLQGDGGDIADFAREPALAAAKGWGAHEKDEVPPHQPASARRVASPAAP
jgi:hypothetical protein